MQRTEVRRRSDAEGLRSRTPWLLALGGLLVICLMLALTWISSTQVLEDTERFERSRLPKLLLLQTAKSNDLDASIALRNVLLNKDPAFDGAELSRYFSAVDGAQRGLDQLTALTIRADERDRLGQFLAARMQLMERRNLALAVMQKGEVADPGQMVRDLQSALDGYLAHMTAFEEFQSGRLSVLVEEVTERTGRVRLLLLLCAIAAALSIAVVALSWRATLRHEILQREDRIHALHAQKEALIAEVHHRIKNHLQGLLSLIEARLRATCDGDARLAVESLRGNVLALVGIHGLQTRKPLRAVTLKDLVRQQVELVRSGLQASQIAMSEDEYLEGVELSQDMAVPLALVVTEMLVNAIKHGDSSPVTVTLGRAGEGAFVAVRNGLIGPTPLDLAAGQGVGTGLGLAVTLAQDFAEIEQRIDGSNITMTLRLTRLEPVST